MPVAKTSRFFRHGTDTDNDDMDTDTDIGYGHGQFLAAWCHQFTATVSKIVSGENRFFILVAPFIYGAKDSVAPSKLVLILFKNKLKRAESDL